MPDARTRSDGGLEAALLAGRFVLTAEITPPDAASPESATDRAGMLKGVVDAVNVTDGAGARAHMSAFACAALLARAGIEPVLQFTVRDRNRLALQGDLIGMAALGIPNLLCLHGDDVKNGDQPETKMIHDIDSRALMSTARQLRDEGVFPSGRKVQPAPRLFIGAADAPQDPKPDFSPKGLEAKIAAGADFFQTQFVFDEGIARRYFGRLRDLGITEKAHFIVGVGPLLSAKQAHWMRDNLFGVAIPDATIARLEAAADQKAEGRRICIELLHAFTGIPGIAGAHLMAPQQKASAIADVAAEAAVRSAKAAA
ncbi:MAG: 5,10-methylenetetrahydrofolate reductase [Alphaproteobacteria bacterium]|nr:5,10-methylenetetrahydrofolate reductase [Alphaproteobacteria bacterium]